MKPEQAFYKLLKPNIPGLPERIENAAGAGNPDFFCIWAGRVYWVEVKVAKSINYSVKDLLEPSQIAWARRYQSHGGTIFFVVRHKDTISVFDGSYALLEKLEKPFDWKKFSLAIHLKLMQEFS